MCYFCHLCGNRLDYHISRIDTVQKFRCGIFFTYCTSLQKEYFTCNETNFIDSSSLHMLLNNLSLYQLDVSFALIYRCLSVGCLELIHTNRLIEFFPIWASLNSMYLLNSKTKHFRRRKKLKQHLFCELVVLCSMIYLIEFSWNLKTSNWNTVDLYISSSTFFNNESPYHWRIVEKIWPKNELVTPLASGKSWIRHWLLELN